MAKPASKKVQSYLESNPDASAKIISDKFGVSVAYAYVLRSKMKKAKPKASEWDKASDWEAPPVPPVSDMVNHPAHYKAGGIETIDFIEAKKLNYHLGNVVKYITRADLKGDRLENLKKAQWYLEREIAQTAK